MNTQSPQKIISQKAALPETRPKPLHLAASCLSLLALSSLSASAATVLDKLDSFDGGEQSNTIFNVGVERSSQQSSEIVGGNRNSTSTVLKNPFQVATSIHFDRRGSGVLSISYGSSASGNVTIEYNGSNGSGLGGHNLLANDANSLGWNILFIDNPVTFQVLLTDTAGQQAESTLEIDGSQSSSGSFLLSYNSFTLIENEPSEAARFNWSSVDRISFQIDSKTSTDLVIDSFNTFHDDRITNNSAIPEPSTSLSILTAGILLTQRRRRLKPKTAALASKSAP